ncbi:ABC transporter substrate-binding protein [Fusobacterium sp. PH5-44]|uniref:ABC transporter substrate-binding protein n=1 Tax=unclassified Fusobacterium TaxID=2648384 RepID=UPI003D1E5A57
MIKKICIILLLSISAFGNKEDKIYKFVVPEGIPSLSIAFMVSNTEKTIEKIENEKIKHFILDKEIEYSIEKVPESLVGKLLKKEPDIAIVPSNLAAQLYNKNLGYKIVGTVSWGSFYLVGTKQLTSFDQLKMKDLKSSKLKIGMIGKGLTPDIVFQNILISNNINAEKDIELEYYSSGNEVLPLYLGRKLDMILIPEPLLTKLLEKSPETKISFNLNLEWKKIYKSTYGYPQGTLIVNERVYNNKELLFKLIDMMKNSVDDVTNKSQDEVKEKIYKMYLKAEYKNNSKFIKEDKDKLQEKLILIYSNIKDVICRSNMDFVQINNTKEEYKNYFKEINEMDKKMIGGQIPDDKIFMEK